MRTKLFLVGVLSIMVGMAVALPRPSGFSAANEVSKPLLSAVSEADKLLTTGEKRAQWEAKEFQQAFEAKKEEVKAKYANGQIASGSSNSK